MRLWSIHPQYLDSKSLVALWREGLLARKVLEGKTRGYTKHPQLIRFKNSLDPIKTIDFYLEAVAMEAKKRGYFFDTTNIELNQKVLKIPVTDGQITHEGKHLNLKLQMRPGTTKLIDSKVIKIHPLFKLIKGRVEQWEKVSDNLKSFPYDIDFSKVDFRNNPELYKVGVGEQGVLLVEPYKSEILPYWKFKTPEIADKSARAIYSLFLAYKKKGDFVGMDMARKYLQMGYTRSRRYANHPSGRKYDPDTQKVLPQADDWKTNAKAQSARIFYAYYLKVKNDKQYTLQKKSWVKELKVK